MLRLITIVLCIGGAGTIPTTSAFTAQDDNGAPPPQEVRITTLVYDVRDLLPPPVDAPRGTDLALLFPRELLPRDASERPDRRSRDEHLSAIASMIEDIIVEEAEQDGAADDLSIEAVDGNLVVRATAAGHREVQATLSRLRAIRAQAADIEARFFEADPALFDDLGLVFMPSMLHGRPTSHRARLNEEQTEALLATIDEAQVEMLASPRIMVLNGRSATMAISSGLEIELPIAFGAEGLLSIAPLDGVALWLKAAVFNGFDPEEWRIELDCVAGAAGIDAQGDAVTERAAADRFAAGFGEGEAMLLRVPFVRNTLRSVHALPRGEGEWTIHDIRRTRIEEEQHEAEEGDAAEPVLYVLIRPRLTKQEEDASLLFPGGEE